jgi:hypothetical protein
MVHVHAVWIVVAGFALLLVGTVAGIALATLVMAPRKLVPPLSVRIAESVQSPLANIPFDNISERFLPEFKTFLTERIAVSSSNLLSHEPTNREGHERISAEQVAKSCELAKAIGEAADEKSQEALNTLLDVVQKALNTEGQSTATAVIVAAGAAVTASALAIVAACASLLVSLREGVRRQAELSP